MDKVAIPAAHNEATSDDDNIREQDRLLPIANVSRIMKSILPANAKIAKEAKETIQECVSEFICFITSGIVSIMLPFQNLFLRASDRCQQEKRKTISGEDIIWALEALGFDSYVQVLKVYLQKYKTLERSPGLTSKSGVDHTGFDNIYGDSL